MSSIEPQKITTEADTLITLLQAAKEIPLKEAAQKLNIPQETLEAWASFLEEEGIISIKYKFTTPYLSYVGGSGKSGMSYTDEFKKKVASVEKGEDIEALQGLLQSIDSLIKQGDFPRLPDNYDSLLSRIKGISEHISEKNPEHASVFDATLQGIQSALEQAHDLASNGKFDDATKNYVQIHSMLTDVLMELKKLEDEVVKKKISESSDVQALLEEAYTLMNEGKIEQANEIYQQLNVIYAELPRNYVQKKQEIEKTMAKLNRDLAASVDRKHIIAVQQGSAKIADLVAQGNNALKKNSLEDAEKAYLSARKEFSALPPGFLGQKRKLQESLLRLYEDISSGREKLFFGQFSNAAQQLESQLSQLYSLIKVGRINEAVSTYGSAKKTFDSMPSGFLNEKLALQSKLLEAYNQLVTAYQTTSKSDMQKKTEKINETIVQIGNFVASGIYDEASKLYTEVRETFRSLPPGFLKEKTELQQLILDTYERLITFSGQKVAQDVHNKVDEVNKILDEAFNFLKHKRDGLAHELYMQSIILYNKLPSGFLQSKSQLRQRMLGLYREIITKLDTPAREDFTESAESKYNEILKLIVNTRHYIGKKQFDMIEPEYRNIIKLFSQLPIGFAQRSTQLMKEMKEIGQEVKLYKLLGILATLTSTAEIGKALEEIYPIKQFVAQNCLEDVELSNYADAVCNQYVQRMTLKKGKEGRVIMPALFRKPAEPQLPSPDLMAVQQPAINEPLPGQAPEMAIQQPSIQLNEMPPASEQQAQEEAFAHGIDELQEKIQQLKEKAKPSVVMPGTDPMR
jgi:hypothetical protein